MIDDDWWRLMMIVDDDDYQNGRSTAGDQIYPDGDSDDFVNDHKDYKDGLTFCPSLLMGSTRKVQRWVFTDSNLIKLVQGPFRSDQVSPLRFRSDQVNRSRFFKAPSDLIKSVLVQIQIWSSWFVHADLSPFRSDQVIWLMSQYSSDYLKMEISIWGQRTGSTEFSQFDIWQCTF